ncbi:DUF292-domain-containing protein [Lindgomyces ingoldianus]|uniref:DUF292-domain-containing protein n=1 Tax=Lindgomyces ingoldianus TaxID=673940 RepID=A0ACB6RGE3_9PLEO|nr:DUF292-domain-containing protein [Lindgomyces ingoldianus]KAF2478187.1 DUF292-domain-containing protein [Lindgomyces ingoldianus]
MAPPTSLVNRLKVQLKLSISRLRMVQQKDSAKAKQQRREMAQLLEAGKLQSAKIRVENIIRSDINTELHEMLELYCELLLARSQLLDPPSSPYGGAQPHNAIPLDPALEEAVRSIIYAAPRTEVKELHTTRALLVEKFGKDVALEAMEGDGVAERVLNKLKVETPKPELVDAYLTEIARFYGVPYGESHTNDDDDDEGGGGIGELAEEPEAQKQLEPALEAEPGAKDPKDQREEDEVEELSKATPPRKFGPQSPLRITPPSPSTDNVAPKLRLPGNTATKAKVPAAAPKAAAKKDEGPGGKIPDVDELARRFAQLKR